MVVSQTYAQQLPVALETGAEILCLFFPIFFSSLSMSLPPPTASLPPRPAACPPFPFLFPIPIYCSHLTMSQARTTHLPPFLPSKNGKLATSGSNSTQLLLAKSAEGFYLLLRPLLSPPSPWTFLQVRPDRLYQRRGAHSFLLFLLQ